MYGRPSAPSGFRLAGFGATGGALGSTDTITGSGSGPRGSLIRTRSKVPPPGAPLVPVTIRRPLLNVATHLSVYAVLPSALTWVTSNLMPSGPNVPSTNASVVASVQ